MTRARDLADGIFEQATGGVLKLETSDTTVTDGSVLGKIEFKAPDEASGTDAILVGAAIEAVAEGTFAADNNATELVFKTGASAAADQKMVLTSAGNFLVGTTNITPSINGVEGIALSAGSFGGRLEACRNNGGAVSFGRLTSDGDIMDFKKDGTTVGSIGVQSTDQLYIGTTDGSGVGIVFDGDNRKIDATNGAGSNLDNAVDLGNGSHRFKDLYLSGGLFLGGTGADNKLRDVERGSFTPTYSSGFSSISYQNQRGSYTKIDRLVTIQILINLGSATGTSAIIEISGLPFSAANANFAYGGFYKSYNAGFNTNDGDTYHKQNSNAVIGIYNQGGGARTGNSSGIGTGGEIILVGQYYTA